MIHETYTQARARLAALMKQVAETGAPVLIRRRGQEPVALVPAREVAGWLETVFQLGSPQERSAASGRESAGCGWGRRPLHRRRASPAARSRWRLTASL